MSTVLDHRTAATIPRAGDAVEDRFIRVRDVLVVRRQHPPTRPFTLRPEPESLDDCAVAQQRHIQAFRIEGPLRWVDYNEVTRRFEGMAAAGSKLAPFSRAEVFAPVKVILAESDRPIRAALAYGPVYPWQNKLATLRPGQRLWLAYAAVAVLNSRYGQAYYERHLAAHPPRALRRHGLNLDAVNSVPVARRDYGFKELGRVAALTHQLISLYEARQDCLPRLSGVRRGSKAGHVDALYHFHAVFEEQIRAVEGRLKQEIPRLLGLDEREEQALLAGGDVSESWSPQQPLFQEGDVLQPLPPPPPVLLLDPSGERRLATGSGGFQELDALQQLRHWQDVINSLPPREVRVEEVAQVPAA